MVLTNEIGNVAKYNLMSLDVAQVENDIDYLLFVDHEESMEHYTHLKPIIKELAELMVRTADRAVAEFQQEMTNKIAAHLKDEVVKVVYDTQINTTGTAIVTTEFDDEKIVSQKVVATHDW